MAPPCTQLLRPVTQEPLFTFNCHVSRFHLSNVSKNYPCFSSATVTIVIQGTQIIFQPGYRSSLFIVDVPYPRTHLFCVPAAERVGRTTTKSQLITFRFAPHLVPPALSVTVSLVSHFLQLPCSYPAQAPSQVVLCAHDHSPPHHITSGNG